MPPAETVSRESIAAGEVAKPPFAVLPDPGLRFKAHAKRFAALAEGHELAGYLRFLAQLSEAQHLCQDGLPAAHLPPAAELDQAYDHAMPPLPVTGFAVNAVALLTLQRIAELLAARDLTAEALLTVETVRAMPDEACAEILHNILSAEIPADEIGVHVLAAAALQVHFARMAAQLEAARLTKVAPGVCPCCGSAPVASLVVVWPKLQGHRYCCCSLCGTKWNAPRVTCVLCGSEKSVAYQAIEGGSQAVQAETCDECHSYVKIMAQHKDIQLDPVADDVATLGLDVLLRDAGYRRGAANPFLLGY